MSYPTSPTRCLVTRSSTLLSGLRHRGNASSLRRLDHARKFREVAELVAVRRRGHGVQPHCSCVGRAWRASRHLMPRAAPSLKSDCGLRRRRCAQAVDAVFRSQAGVWGELAPRYRMGRPTRACETRPSSRSQFAQSGPTSWFSLVSTGVPARAYQRRPDGVPSQCHVGAADR